MKFKELFEGDEIKESLRNPSSLLMKRAVSNMKKPSEVETEFKDHTSRIANSDEASELITGRQHTEQNSDVDAERRHFNHPISKPITLFKGVSKNNPIVGGIRDNPEGEHSLSGSTSTRRAISKNFASHSMIVIHAHPGTMGAHISGHPDVKDWDDENDGTTREHEIALHPDTKVRYLGTEKIGGIDHHHVETIPSSYPVQGSKPDHSELVDRHINDEWWKAAYPSKDVRRQKIIAHLKTQGIKI